MFLATAGTKLNLGGKNRKPDKNTDLYERKEVKTYVLSFV